MEFLKALFDAAENGALTFEQLKAACKEKGIKPVDLSGGEYVSKHKYDDDLKAKDTTIDTLKGNLAARDTDIAQLKDDLKKSGDDAQKVSDLGKQLEDWQTKYKTDTDNLNAKLAKQAKEFAVRDCVNGRQFTSNAAKRDFENYMMQQEFTIKDDKIIGIDDFVTAYTKDNQDAFVQEKKEDSKQPAFVTTTNGKESVTATGGEFSFNFTPLHPKKD